MFKRFSSVLLIVVILCCMVVSSGAASLSGTVDLTFNGYNRPDTGISLSFPRAASAGSVFESSHSHFLEEINIPPSVNLGASGAVSFYISFYYGSDSALEYYDSSANMIPDFVYFALTSDPTNWAAGFYDINGTVVSNLDSFTFDTFTPISSDPFLSPGFTLNVEFHDVEYMSGLYVSHHVMNYINSISSYNCYVPSISVVAAETAADIEALEGIADQIAAGNAIAQAMYGDIMAVLNSISGDTTDIVSYLTEALTLLNSISGDTAGIYSLCYNYLHYLSQIAATSSSIDAELKAYHEDFLYMMGVLQGTIIEEADDIEAKMEEIYGLLIAYLDTQYSSAVNPDLIESAGNVQTDIKNSGDLEGTFQSNLTETWTDLKLETFSIGGGYASAVAWVSSWFSNFFNAMGDYGMIILLPLYVGIVTLVAGLARQSIRRSGRSDRGRGDSQND